MKEFDTKKLRRDFANIRAGFGKLDEKCDELIAQCDAFLNA